MTLRSVAIAVFVKTPGFSPIKTRLAAEIGEAMAEEFYRLSVAAVAATLTATAQATGATPYWAVAEKAALEDSLWQQFARISQGVGGLGERLHHVCDRLFSNHPAVIAIGADSPQLIPPLLQSAISLLLENGCNAKHVLGRSHDGGFYLAGSNVPVSRQVWTSLTYSVRSTAEDLAKQLNQTGKIEELPRLTDVDELQDLLVVGKQMRTLSHLSPEQWSLVQWIEASVCR